MNACPVHTLETAPPASRPLLNNAEKDRGRIPNLLGVMTESPATLESCMAMMGLFQKTSLTPTERHVVWLAIDFTNNCHYCVPAHSGMALNDGVEPVIARRTCWM